MITSILCFTCWCWFQWFWPIVKLYWKLYFTVWNMNRLNIHSSSYSTRPAVQKTNWEVWFQTNFSLDLPAWICRRGHFRWNAVGKDWYTHSCMIDLWMQLLLSQREKPFITIPSSSQHLPSCMHWREVCVWQYHAWITFSEHTCLTHKQNNCTHALFVSYFLKKKKKGGICLQSISYW